MDQSHKISWELFLVSGRVCEDQYYFIHKCLEEFSGEVIWILSWGLLNLFFFNTYRTIYIFYYLSVLTSFDFQGICSFYLNFPIWLNVFFFFIKSFFMFAVSVMVSDFWQFVLPLSVFKEPTFRLKIIFSITFCFYFYFFPSIFL